MAWFNFLQNYFQQPIEHDYYVNGIPGGRIFELPALFYFYAFIILVFALYLILKRISLIKSKKSLFNNRVFIYFILFFWLLTSARWFSVQARWIRDDFNDFSNKTITEQRAKAVIRSMKTKNLPNNWYDFYDFLEFSKKQIPQNSKVYVLPADPTFLIWSKYWLSPDLVLVDSSKKADYLISFNVELPEIIEGFGKFKEFKLNKIIFKAKND